MTIGAVGKGGPFALELEGSFTSAAGQLAALILENEEAQKTAQRESLHAARENFTAALEEELDALHEQADATRLSAVIQGGLVVVGGGLMAWSATTSAREQSWQSISGKASHDLGQPLGQAFGHNYGAADAKAAQGQREQANWEIEDARQRLRSADATQDKAVDWVSSLIAQDAAVTTSVLSNKA